LLNSISPDKKYKLTLLGFITGCCSGLLGVGGATIMLPLLTRWLKYDQKTAQGTALGVIIPTAALGALFYARFTAIPVAIALPLTTGAMLGVLLGSAIVWKIPNKILTKLFGGLLLVAAAVLALD
jgi:uncharacterized membrane protein YfcA